jgi:hypothetical protein
MVNTFQLDYYFPVAPIRWATRYHGLILIWAEVSVNGRTEGGQGPSGMGRALVRLEKADWVAFGILTNG